MAAEGLAIEVTYPYLHRQSPGRDGSSPGGVCDSITNNFRGIDLARQPNLAVATASAARRPRSRAQLGVEEVQDAPP
jgi:hypothetical protein